MKYFFFMLWLQLTGSLVQGQTYFVDNKQLNITFYQQQEKKIKSVFRENRENHLNVSPYKLAQPLKYERTNPGFQPRPVIEYYFSLPDSIVREIHLEIDSLNYLDKTHQAMTSYKEKEARLGEFDKQYEAIRVELRSAFGEPAHSQPLRLKKENNNAYWQREDKWQNDSVTVYMYLVFSSQASASGTYRVRANINYANKQAAQPAASVKPAMPNPEQEALAKQYLALLLKADYQGSWNLLSEQAKRQIDYQQYVNAVTPISELKKQHGKKTQLYMRGINMHPQAGQVIFYSFKFQSDLQIPPAALVDVVFKDEKSREIIGVRPKTMVKMSLSPQ